MFSKRVPSMGIPSMGIPSMGDPFTCETCRVVFELTKPTDIDASFAELLATGWMQRISGAKRANKWCKAERAAKAARSAKFTEKSLW
jgi:hypothetical protein